MALMEIKGHGLECNLQFSKPDSEDWMSVKISIVTPSLKGGFTCTMEVIEFKSFVAMLTQLKNAIGKEFEITWGNIEENIEFTLRLEEIGRLTGSYKFSPNNFILGPTLSGDFTADQSFIESWLKQAEEIVADVS